MWISGARWPGRGTLAKRPTTAASHTASRASECSRAASRASGWKKKILAAALVTAGIAVAMYYLDEPSADALLRPVEQRPDARFTPIAFGVSDGKGLGLGLGYAGGF